MAHRRESQKYDGKVTNSEERKSKGSRCNRSAAQFGLAGASHMLKLKKADRERNVVATCSHIPRRSLRRPFPNPLDPPERRWRVAFLQAAIKQGLRRGAVKRDAWCFHRGNMSGAVKCGALASLLPPLLPLNTSSPLSQSILLFPATPPELCAKAWTDCSAC